MSYWGDDGSYNTLAGIVPNSPQSLGALMNVIGFASPSNGSYPTANKAFFIPFVVQQRSIAKKMTTGAAISSGNLDLGIYNAQGVRLSHSGSVAESGSPQTVDIPFVVLVPGQVYYMAISRSSVGSVMNVLNWGGTTLPRIFGIRQMDSAFPLPAQAVFAQMTANLIQGIGVLFEAISA